MQTVVFYILMLGFAGGVLLRSFLFLEPELLLFGLVIALGLAILQYHARRTGEQESPRTHRREQVLFCIVLGLVAIVVGAFRFGLAEEHILQTNLHEVVGENVTIVGTVVAEPDVRAVSTLLTVATDDTKVLIRTDRYANVSYGDLLSVTGKLEVPEAFVTELGREFDYVGYLHARGITHTMSFANLSVVEEQRASPLSYLYFAKEYFLSRLALVIDEPAVALGGGLLLGVQAALGEKIEDDFRTTGIIHIVVLSGYNIMLVVAFVMYVFAYLLPFRMRLVFGIGAVVLFALLVGYSPSVLRASLMAILFLLASLLARPYLILRMLVLAGVLMIMWNPYILRYDIGFQLSFMATLGLILVAPQLEMAFTRVSTWFSIRSFLVATIATQVAVAPLLLYHIGEWSLVAVPVNVLVLPMVPIAMLLTFLTGLVAMGSVTIAMSVGFLAELSLGYIINVAALAAEIPFAAVAIPPFPGFLVPASYVVLGLMWYRFVYLKSTQETAARVTATSTDTFDQWTIVEEFDTPALTPPGTKEKVAKTNALATSSQSKPSPTAEVPIFFR